MAAAFESFFDVRVVVLVSGLFAAACGGGSSSSSPAVPSPPSDGGTATTATVTITTTGVAPKTITIARGSRVTFVNNDTRSHDIESDPHPLHTDCPELNQVGILGPGQSHQSGVLNVARSCGYHDHEQSDVAALQGTITIQ